MMLALFDNTTAQPTLRLCGLSVFADIVLHVPISLGMAIKTEGLTL